MVNCNPSQTPLCSSTRLEKGEADAETPPHYQKLIGCLMYLAVLTRPEVSHAVSVLNQFNNCCTQLHWKAAKRVLRYLRSTSDNVLKYCKDGCELQAFSDADWMSCPMDRKSYTGFVLIIGYGAWESKKQRSVGLSSTESEYVALSEAGSAGREVKALHQLISELLPGYPSPTTMHCDNLGTIKVASNEGRFKKLKHVDGRYHWIREAVSNGTISLQHVPSADMVADVTSSTTPQMYNIYGSTKRGNVACYINVCVIPN